MLRSDGDRLQAWSSIGYPENFRAGREMLVAEGERGESAFSGTVKMSSNPMGFGSSGGGWWAASPGGAARMIGLNSFNLASQPDWEFGPVFDGTIQALARHVATSPHLIRHRSRLTKDSGSPRRS